jgi:TolA-binding protein
MKWKETVEELPKLVKTLMAQVAAQSKRLERIEAQLQDLHREKSQSVEQMADRLIEMSMVQRGESREANMHRRTTPGISQNEPSNLWGDLPDEAQWPPKNVDVVVQL